MAATVDWQPKIEALPDGRYRVESRSRPGEYHLVERKNGRLHCSCEAFWHRHGPRGEMCRHHSELAAHLVQQVGR